MKIASRFPVKNSKVLLILVILLHLVVLFLSFFIVKFLWQYGLAVISLFISFYFSIKQLTEITQASDDLCWTGDQWLISSLNDRHKLEYRETVYLSILPSSWITSGFSLLKFRVDSLDGKNAELTWFFSSLNLGDRLYRELCFLSKESLKQQSRLNSDKLG